MSGKNIIKMAALKESLSSLPIKDAQTYIQSGNLVFGADKTSPEVLANLVQKKILKDFGMKVPITIRTSDELKKILKTNPFLKTRAIPSNALHVTFLSDRPTRTALAQLMKINAQNDQFEVVGREIFLYCSHGYGQTKLTNTLFEKVLSLQATTRNWKTVSTLYEMSIKL